MADTNQVSWETLADSRASYCHPDCSLEKDTTSMVRRFFASLEWYRDVGWGDFVLKEEVI